MTELPKVQCRDYTKYSVEKTVFIREILGTPLESTRLQLLLHLVCRLLMS